MKAVVILILAGLLLCWGMGRKNRMLKKKLNSVLLPPDYDRELELVLMEEEEFIRQYQKATGNSPREMSAMETDEWQGFRAQAIAEIAQQEGWAPTRAEKERDQAGRDRQSNQAPLLATTQVFLYNRTIREKVVPFPTDHRGKV